MVDPLAQPVRDANGAALTLAWRRVIGPGFALPRDADRRSAVQAVGVVFRGWRWEFRGRWPRCRSEDRRSEPSPRFFAVGVRAFAALWAMVPV